MIFEKWEKSLQSEYHSPNFFNPQGVEKRIFSLDSEKLLVYPFKGKSFYFSVLS